MKTLDLLLMSRFAIVSTGWKTRSSAIPTQIFSQEANTRVTAYQMHQTQALALCQILFHFRYAMEPWQTGKFDVDQQKEEEEEVVWPNTNQSLPTKNY